MACVWSGAGHPRLVDLSIMTNHHPSKQMSLYFGGTELNRSLLFRVNDGEVDRTLVNFTIQTVVLDPVWNGTQLILSCVWNEGWDELQHEQR